MPTSCSVIGCSSRGVSRKFYSFPMLRNKTSKQLAMTQARQQAWLVALNRADFFADQYKAARVCDLHFISGKSASYADVDDPDWVPSLQLGYEKEGQNHINQINEEVVGDPVVVDPLDEEVVDDPVVDPLNKEIVGDPVVVDPLNEEVAGDPVNEEFVDVPPPKTAFKETQTFIPTSSTGSQTDGHITGMSDEQIISYEERIQLLEEMLNKYNVTLSNFKGQDKKTKFFTGISNYATLEALFEMLEPKFPISLKLSKFQIFFIVLTRLRLNLSFRYLSYQFGVSIATISKYFYKCLLKVYNKLKNFVYWPTREAIKKTTPLCFQNSFGDAITIILDCFEIFCEKPANQKAMAQCFSRYKHAYTIKYLIGITPQGFISFISKGFGGRCSDKFVTEKSGFFNKVQIGDVIMADRGFLIEEELLHRGVELTIPAFTKGKSQLHPRDIEGTRSIANVRIHVERIIGQLRQKFTILHQYKFPMSLIKKKGKSSVNVIDHIVTVCSALSNLCTPIVSKVSNDESL